MKLTDLAPRFMKCLDEEHHMKEVPFAEAQGIMFDCPGCRKKYGQDGPEKHGVHSILIWFDGKGVTPDWTPTPRWTVSGTGFEDLSTTPSILVHGCWHGYITKGEITFC